jgi:TPR repeat protein
VRSKPPDANALTELADSLTNTFSRGRKFDAAVRLYRRAFRLGYVIAGYNLACAYQNVGDYRRAVSWFRQLLDAGHLDALVPLAQAELHGVGTKRDVPAAIAKLERIASGGSFAQFDREQAMITLATILREGWLVQRNYPKAVKWLRRAVNFGSLEARGLLDDLDDVAVHAVWRPFGR